MSSTSISSGDSKNMGGACTSRAVDTSIITSTKPSFTKTIENFHKKINLPKQRKKRASKGQISGTEKLEQLFSIYKVSEDVKFKSKEMFKKFLFLKLCRKGCHIALAGCCFYIALKEENISITTRQLCSQLNCNARTFNSIIVKIKNHTGMEMQISIKDLMPSVLEGMSSDKEKEQLITKSKKLIKLCESCWLTTGRSPKSIAIACAFLCWKSLDITRLRTAFKRFADTYSIEYSQATYLRIQEIKLMLLKLLKSFNFPEDDWVDQFNVCYYLDTILANSSNLRAIMLPLNLPAEEVAKKEFEAFRSNIRRTRIDEESLNKSSVSDFGITQAEFFESMKNYNE